MIKVFCDRCGDELEGAGALYFGLPSASGNVVKKHICKTCVPVFEIVFTKTTETKDEEARCRHGLRACAECAWSGGRPHENHGP